MADARSRILWHHTSSLMALTANINRDRKQKPSPFRPSDFDPHSRRHPRGEVVSVAQLTNEIMAITAAKQRQRERAANPKRMKAQNG